MKVNTKEDPNDTFIKNLDKNERYVWLCNDCKKFMYTKEYSKDHKRCWADLVENMYEDIKKINEENLESVQAMKSEFKEESDFFKKNLPILKKIIHLI